MPPRRTGRIRVSAFAAVLVLTAAACSGLPNRRAPAPRPAPRPAAPVQRSLVPPAGMRLVFNDEFTGSAVNTSRWDTCYPWAHNATGCTNFGNHELQWYRPSRAWQSGGLLHLTASATPTAGTTRDGQPMTYPWTSGMVTTAPSFNFTYGFVQIVANVPKGSGFWPALWLLPQTQAWPPEIDIQETWGSDTHSTMLNFHPVGGPQRMRMHSSSTDMSVGWHTYAVDWKPGSITWYLDGKVVHQYVGTDVPSQPMYFLANLAISGDYPPNGATQSTASFHLDSVKIYQR